MGGIVKGIFGGGKKAPDPYATSDAQAKASTEAARVTAALNRADQYTPWGSLTWEQGPGQDEWASTITLDPRQQALLDRQLENSLSLGGAENAALGRVNQLGQVNPYSAPAGGPPTANEDYRKQIQDALYGQMTSRLDPRFQQQESDLTSRLAAQGITQGSQAYDREFSNFGRDRNDAYQSALNNAITGGEQAVAGQYGRDLSGRQQSVSEADMAYKNQFAGRNQVLNELSALRTGSQVQTPQFGSTQSGAAVQAPNVEGNIWNSYNAGQAQQAQGMNNILGLGNLGLAAFTAFSDRRLKSNIVRTGTHPLGIGLYEYDIFGERQRGVMADEVETVLPSAVSTHSSGFKMVDYSQL
ncbi:MAG: tail fiber domain-containing protein [Bryobacteraceae bacterium]